MQRLADDPIAQARRHIAEAQQHIARQERLVARLSSDGRHVALAAEAQEILNTLKHTLSIRETHRNERRTWVSLLAQPILEG